MPAYLKLGSIKGECTNKEHQDWIIIESLNAPIYRSIPDGALGHDRTRGETTCGDIMVVRELDKSSTLLSQACARGEFFDEVEIHFCTTVLNKQEPYLKYKLTNVIVTSYSFHGVASADPIPTEEISLNFAAVEWTYVVLDPKTGEVKGNVPGSYDPETE